MFSIFEKPIALLRLESGAVLLLALAIYWHQSFSWTLFWSMVLLPDLALFGYLVNAKVGARAYNITHAKLLPSVLAAVAVATDNSLLIALALIWFAHIGVDRLLGYGLKYPASFKDTHLGIIGRKDGEARGLYSPCES